MEYIALLLCLQCALCLEQFYMGTIPEQPDNLIVQPKFVNYQINDRIRRSGSELEIDARNKFKDATIVEIEDWILLLEENNHITFADQWFDSNCTDCKFYFGSVLYESGSKVAMTVCGGDFYGFLEAGESSFFIEPISNPGGHLMYKAGRELDRIKRCADCASETFNLTGDLLDDLDFNFTEETNQNIHEEPINEDKIRRIRTHDDDDVGYFVDTAWETRPYNPQSGVQERWLELALAVDYTVIDFHGRDKIRPYLMTLMNIVSAIYKDPSLDANMHLVLSRLVLYENKKDTQIREGNARKSLEAVNRWNYHLIGSLPKNEKPHDVAVWLTRENLGGPSGYAPVAGVCDRSRSTALNKDEGLASAFIIAHEMAHILGLTHDGDSKAANHCDDEVQKGTVMAPTVTAAFNRFTWSSCSKEEFHRLIKRWTCLLNPPTNKNLLEEEASYTFSMDEQCRMEYGDGYGMCKSFELIEPCTHLWCGHENSSLYCFTKKGPPVEGTMCGFDKWCVDGYCQAVDGRLAGRRQVDGGWGSWSRWGECSRPCGYGIKSRSRRCDNPNPEYGGAQCVGEDQETVICKGVRPCWSPPFLDSKAEMCSNLSTKSGEEWLPYEEKNEESCQVGCVLWSTGEVVRSGESPPDGTPCSYDNEHHICIKGKCRKLGCDGLENSTVVQDSCGECGGSGRSCLNSNLVFRKIFRKELSKIMMFPKQTRGISIKITLRPKTNNQILDSLFHLSVKLDQDRIYKLRGPVQYGRQRPEPSGTVEEASVIVVGTAFRMTRKSSSFEMTAPGPTHGDITIMMSTPEEYLNIVEATVELNYTLPSIFVTSQTSGRYTWMVSKCRCGPRPLGPYCVDTLHANQTVDSRRCSEHSRINVITEDCDKLKCEYRWVSGEWEYCSATCGDKGIQERQLYCIPTNIDDEVLGEKPWIYMVQPDKCTDDKPSNVKACNRVSCPVHWVEESWTECSSTCGPGISIKPMRCVARANNTEDCGPPPAAQWRSCQGSCPQKPCYRDKSRYCTLSYISKYCVLPEFEKLCCMTCRSRLVL